MKVSEIQSFHMNWEILQNKLSEVLTYAHTEHTGKEFIDKVSEAKSALSDIEDVVIRAICRGD